MSREGLYRRDSWSKTSLLQQNLSLGDRFCSHNGANVRELP